MKPDDDFLSPRPDGLVEHVTTPAAGRRATSYASAVPRLRRRLPSAPADRRAKARLEGEPWRGRLIDLKR